MSEGPLFPVGSEVLFRTEDFRDERATVIEVEKAGDRAGGWCEPIDYSRLTSQFRYRLKLRRNGEVIHAFEALLTPCPGS